MHGIKRALLLAADEHGLAGIVECITPVLWTRFTGETASSMPSDLFDAVRRAVEPGCSVPPDSFHHLR